MTDNIKDLLAKLKIEATGNYDNHFYVIQLDDSDAYARMYTTLCNNATNTEDPAFQVNTNNMTTKITNYFTTTYENKDYNIFLIADFDNDKYYVKFREL